MRYRADNQLVVDTTKMELVLETGHDGQYGWVREELYRTKTSHNWYLITESSWSGGCSLSSAELFKYHEAAGLVMRHCPSRIDRYPELLPVVKDVIDE